MATIGKYAAKDGTTLWEVRYRTPDQRSTRKRGFATQRDAKAFAATTETSKLKGEFVSASAGRVTIGEIGPAWLERQRGHLKPTTMGGYESVWRVHIEPRWGSVRIGSIKPSDVQSWVTDLSSRRGAGLVHYVSTVFTLILSDAVKDGLLAANPASGVKLPKLPPARNIYLSAPQLRMLADTVPSQYRSLILLLGVGGLRWGEAAVLRPCDIDFLRRRVELHRNVTFPSGFHVGSLKSNKNRTVVVPQFVIDALAASCEGKGRDELIWPAPQTGGFLRTPSAPHRWFGRAVARCQAADPTFPRVWVNALRHTAASLAVHSGANAKVVQRMLGHSKASLTMDVYADLFETDLDTVAEKVAAAWELDA